MVKTIEEGLNQTAEGRALLNEFNIQREKWLKAKEKEKLEWNKLQEVANKKHSFMRLD